MKKSPRIFAFIDSQNLNLGIRNDVKRGNKVVHKGWQLDYKRFYVYLKQKYSVSEAFLFIGKVEGNEKLYKFLTKSGYKIVFKKTLSFNKSNENITKGNVDAELVLHSAKIQYDNFDQAIIVSGDGDFYCLIEFLESKGKLSKVLIPNQYAYSSLLTEYKKFISFVSQAKNKLILK